ncbi:MAG: hypothetical protein ABI791_15395 [Acidobacteriota bacterium]
MNNQIEMEPEEKDEPTFRERISGAGQVILGEIETIGGVLTGDPMTQAEGEFNVEVGSVREQAEHNLEDSDDTERPEED